MHFILQTMIFRYNNKLNDVFYSPNSFYKVYLTASKNSKLKWIVREHIVLMYSTAYNLWTFTWFVHFELPFRLKGTDKIHTEGFSKFIPRNCLNSTLMYILFSLDVIHMAKLAMWPREGTPGRHEPPLWETSLFYAEMSMRNTSICVCQFVQYRKVFFYLCFKFK